MLRIAMLSYHTCPLAILGGKDTGGMNVYVRELTRQLGRMGIHVDVFTRSQDGRARIVVNKTVVAETEIPGDFATWNPLSMAGMPHAANPQAWAFYPPNLLRAVLHASPTPSGTWATAMAYSPK